MLDHLQTKAFRREVGGLRGYDFRYTGKEIHL
jgi:hypothetical protein